MICPEACTGCVHNKNFKTGCLLLVERIDSKCPFYNTELDMKTIENKVAIYLQNAGTSHTLNKSKRVSLYKKGDK